MTPFWPFFPKMTAQDPGSVRQTRLQDIDARMTAFLSQKQVNGRSCERVIDNVKTAKADIQQEMTSR
ncbi:hypothetical protein FMN50_02905 [Rhodobacterales bacterium]|nr:hypothetical protein FMN50_02905 [Rhodobacterales bacterium]